MIIASSINSIYRKVADHIGKLIAGIGLMLMALDVAGQGEQLKQMANDYLGQKGAQKVGIFLFAIAFLRFLYAGYKAAQKQAQIDALQAQVDALTKKSLQTNSVPEQVPPLPALDSITVKSIILVLIGFGLVACRFL